MDERLARYANQRRAEFDGQLLGDCQGSAEGATRCLTRGQRKSIRNRMRDRTAVDSGPDTPEHRDVQCYSRRIAFACFTAFMR